MIDTIYSDPNFLQHHGVKGMKWGQHIFSSKGKKGSPAEQTVGAISRTNRAASNMARRSARTAKRKEASNMSNEELSKYIKRMEMEKRYADLSSSDINSGYEKTQDVLETIGDVVDIAAGLATIATTGYTIYKAVKG